VLSLLNSEMQIAVTEALRLNYWYFISVCHFSTKFWAVISYTLDQYLHLF